MVSSAPGTAIQFFNEAGKRHALGLPLGPFARNVCGEAIANKDSNLYHEDEGYECGYFGYVKPFSQALFGNYELVEALGDRFGSPLDVSYGTSTRWDAEQLEIYTRGVLLTIRDYLRTRRDLYAHSYALSRALHSVQSMCSDLYMIDPTQSNPETRDTIKRFTKAVDFTAEAVAAVDAEKGLELIWPALVQGARVNLAAVRMVDSPVRSHRMGNATRGSF